MIKFAKQEEGLLDKAAHHVDIDWEKLKDEVSEMFAGSKRTLSEYVPIAEEEDDPFEEFQEEEEVEVQEDDAWHK